MAFIGERQESGEREGGEPGLRSAAHPTGLNWSTRTTVFKKIEMGCNNKVDK